MARIIQPSLLRILSPKLSSFIKLGFDMASMMCKLSVRRLRSSRWLHHWVLYLPTTVSGTDLISYNVCSMLSGPANADVTTKPIFPSSVMPPLVSSCVKEMRCDHVKH